MATKTTAPPAPVTDVDPGVALLEEARAHRADVERRLVDGVAVSTAEFAEADHRVELAEAVIAAAEVRRAEEVEAAKRAVIDPIIKSLSDGHLDAQARHLIALHDQAAAAIAALFAAATEHVRGICSAAGELGRADPASRTRTPRSNPGELAIEWGSRVLTLPDGRKFSMKEDIPAMLVAEAASAAVGDPVLAKLATREQPRKQRTIGRLRDVVQAAESEVVGS